MQSPRSGSGPEIATTWRSPLGCSTKRPLLFEAVERISAVEAVIDLRNFAIPAVMEAFRSIFAIADALGSLGEDAAPKDEDAAPKRVAA